MKTEASSAPQTALVLVCSTDPVLQRDVAAVLKREGWPCSTESDPAAAAARLAEGGVAVVLCDLALGPAAIDLLDATRDVSPAPTVVLLTNPSQRQTAARVMKLGAFAYVTKPIYPDEIASHVARAHQWHRQAGRLDESRVARRGPGRWPNPVSPGDEAGRLGAARLLCALRHRDSETAGHLDRIGRYSEVVGLALDWVEPMDSETLRLAAELHDVGKIAIPDSLLQKPGRLTPSEREVVRRHTLLGAAILGRDGGESTLADAAREVCLHHHERWDGGGYPDRLAGESIPRWARIVTVVDVYDALVHDRVYRPAIPENVALGYMRFQRARHFDPRVYDAFIECLPELRKIRWQVKETQAA